MELRYDRKKERKNSQGMGIMAGRKELNGLVLNRNRAIIAERRGKIYP